ncbi:aminoglycoside phosphotransferase family protein [Nocardia sp. alder85J]|uniref:aminoglycoside phosphotransferase family protein n=1 Tax=Nocardia sp. alder85J TaxID=2862949 RepID=UPI001CD1D467|nr:aminoglycoside phosphotransferase family protein [Nocardia sp. alder85J]MCX4091374.1 aminoglycoside phosphotransferase family protein [Nocardia sp. alder85J]
MQTELLTWLTDVAPEHEWQWATIHKGCFHHVVVTDSAVARISCHGPQPHRLARELATLTAVTALRLPVEHPRPLSGVIDTAKHSAMLVTRVPGDERPQPEWSTVADELGGLLRDLHAIRPAASETPLPPPRSWCGGEDWPGIVTDSVLPHLPADSAAAADTVMRDILAVERDAPIGFVHGDFGPHNILWRSREVRSLIDFDHSCLGDPAIDVAALISFYGAGAVSAVAREEGLIERALRHRAGFTLQLAAAAVLVGDQRLFRHAVGNFTTRYRSGTLYDPDGAVPAVANGGRPV